MLEFARGLKSIRSALLNLVELGPGTKQIGSISEYILTYQLHASHSQLMMPTTKLIKKLWSLLKVLERKSSQTHRKTGFLNSPHKLKTLIFHRWSHKCLVDKYQITYQIIWGKGLVRPHLVESSYCKTFGSLKGAPILHHFYIKNIFSCCCYIKENFKNNET